jgi:hypothetical protein
MSANFFIISSKSHCYRHGKTKKKKVVLKKYVKRCLSNANILTYFFSNRPDRKKLISYRNSKLIPNNPWLQFFVLLWELFNFSIMMVLNPAQLKFILLKLLNVVTVNVINQSIWSDWPSPISLITFIMHHISMHLLIIIFG